MLTNINAKKSIVSKPLVACVNKTGIEAYKRIVIALIKLSILSFRKIKNKNNKLIK